jgi:hypothetical protein
VDELSLFKRAVENDFHRNTFTPASTYPTWRNNAPVPPMPSPIKTMNQPPSVCLTSLMSALMYDENLVVLARRHIPPIDDLRQFRCGSHRQSLVTYRTYVRTHLAGNKVGVPAAYHTYEYNIVRYLSYDTFVVRGSCRG